MAYYMMEYYVAIRMSEVNPCVSYKAMSIIQL
jgi:hypothetical protein